MAYILIAPAVAVLLALMFYPIVNVFLMVFSKTDKLSRLKGFVGLQNFKDLFQDKVFWQMTWQSLRWTVTGVITKTLFGMVIAVILNVKYFGRRVARMLFIIPWASAVPISAIIWTWVFNHEFGLLNHSLKVIGITASPPVWLGTPIPAFAATMWVDIWIGIPFMALVFLAGMQAISEDLYESAYLDGVNWLQKFFYITLPSIRRIILIATLLSSLWTFNDFNTIYIMTRGGPAGATDILITGVYKSGFEWLKFSRAAAMAAVTFVILSIVSIVYARIYFRQERT